MIAHTLFLSISSLTSPHSPSEPSPRKPRSSEAKRPILAASKPIEKSEPQGRTLEKAPGGGVRQWGTVHVCCKH